METKFEFWNFQCFRIRILYSSYWVCHVYREICVLYCILYLACCMRGVWGRPGMMKKMWNVESWRCFSAFSTSSSSPSRNFLFTEFPFNIWQSPRHFFQSHDDEKFLFQFIQTVFGEFFASFIHTAFPYLFPFFRHFRSQLKFYYAGKRIVVKKGKEKEDLKKAKKESKEVTTKGGEARRWQSGK